MGSHARPIAPGVTGAGGVVLQTATPADLPEVTALERACYSDPWPPSAFTSLPGNDRVFFVLARDASNARLAGFGIAWFVMDEGELANLAVAPDSRGKGIGTALLEAVTSDALGRGTSQLYLEVRESNSAARHMYEAAGFQEVGRRKGYYRQPVEDALILRRTLKP
jgi:[ribosomal protein S18]-alanine N-acetyltransferase